MNKMEIFTKALAIVSILALIAVVLLVSGAGCGEANAEADAKALDTELGSLEETSNEINNMNMDELSESELEELENLF